MEDFQADEVMEVLRDATLRESMEFQTPCHIPCLMHLFHLSLLELYLAKR